MVAHRGRPEAACQVTDRGNDIARGYHRLGKVPHALSTCWLRPPGFSPQTLACTCYPVQDPSSESRPFAARPSKNRPRAASCTVPILSDITETVIDMSAGRVSRTMSSRVVRWTERALKFKRSKVTLFRFRKRSHRLRVSKNSIIRRRTSFVAL